MPEMQEDADGFTPVRRRRNMRASQQPYVEGGETDVTMALEPAVIDSVTISSSNPPPDFKPVSTDIGTKGIREFRRVQVPKHRYSPLKSNWMNIIAPLVQHMKLEVRMNTKRGCVEIRTSPETKDVGAIQKAADYVRAFMLGFEVQDALAILRLEDLFVESFEIKDVKMLSGDHISRAIGRINGKDGKTKHAIENSTRTRVVVADRYIHILGAYQNLRLARRSISNLIRGSPPGKVYNHLRTVSKRIAERF
eukprot:Selendium_serpulae@DN4557_c0_g1_i3.p1